MEQAEPIRVIYISSASRSGSTMLEAQLAAATGGFACGEMRRITHFMHSDERRVEASMGQESCACGKYVGDCPFWRKIAESANLDLSTASYSSQLGGLGRFFFRLVALFLGTGAVKALAIRLPSFRRELAVGENCFAMYDAIASVTGTACLIDSSKQAYHYILLRVVRPEAMRLLVLVRDGRAVSKSMIRGKRRRVWLEGNRRRKGGRPSDHQEIMRRAAFAWILQTVNSLIIFIFERSSKRFFLRYEEFCSDPGAWLDRLQQQFPLSSTNKQKACLSHAIGGSPSRTTRGFSKISLDESWKDTWNESDLKDFGHKANLLNKLIGYR